MGVTGYILNKPIWQPYISANGKLIEVSLSYSHIIWPWSGWLAISVSISELGAKFTGEAAGQITLTISTPSVSVGTIIVLIYLFILLFCCYGFVVWQYFQIVFPPFIHSLSLSLPEFTIKRVPYINGSSSH